MAIDASITGTPLGAITGSVTNADDGTINGTIGFVATGTISSSVGVPGPAGSPGATGPQGPQGIPGPPGEGGTWGSIVGDIEDQVDLWSELGSKYPASNPAGYITSSALSPYLTTATANATFQTLAGMSSYLMTSAAAAGYYPLTGNPSGFLTAASLSGYATESWVTGQGYITSSALTGYATESFVTSQGYITASALTGYATESFVTSQGYITSSALAGYATESWVAAGFYPLSSNPAGYLTSASLSGYALLSGATFTGTLSAPTPSPGTDSTVVATTEWVKDLDYAPLNSPQFNGNPRGPTPSLSDNDTSLATTEFVKGQGYITSAALSPYLLSSTAASTYAALAGATFTGVVGFNGASGNVAAKSTGYFKAYTSGAESTDYSLQYDTGFQVVVGGSTVARIASSGILAPSAGITFSDASVQTTAGVSAATVAATYAPLASPALTGNPTAPTPATADNDTSIATTAFVKAQGYLTSAPVTSVAGKTGAVTLVVGDVSGAAPLASPTFTGTPAAPTATAGTNTTQIATTAFVTAGLNLKANLASPTFTGTPAAPTASAGTSTTQLATTAFVTTADNLKANLASPAFTGTPTAPTATTGTNTTQIATTAFVTAAVPAAATVAEAKAGNDTAKFISSNVLQKVVNSPSYYKFPRGLLSTNVSGTGATVTQGALISRMVGPSTGAGGSIVRYYGLSGVDIVSGTGWGVGNAAYGINFGKVFRLTGSTQFSVSTNTIVRVSFGKNANNGVGDPNSAAVGWRYNQAVGFIEIIAHDGATLKTLTTTSNPLGWFEWEIFNDGAGNVQMFVNDVSIGTLSGGRTTWDYASAPDYVEEIQTTATPAVQPSVRFRNGGIFLQP